jgi:hypothetical protein
MSEAPATHHARANPHPGTEPAPARTHRRKRLLRLALWLIPAGLLLALMLYLAWLLMQQPYSSLVNLQTYTWRFKYLGLSIQWLAASAALWRWPHLVDWAVRRGQINERDRASALRMRNKAALLMLSLAFVETGTADLARLLHFLTG